jgi:hypothetical protein
MVNEVGRRQIAFTVPPFCLKRLHVNPMLPVYRSRLQTVVLKADQGRSRQPP